MTNVLTRRGLVAAAPAAIVAAALPAMAGGMQGDAELLALRAPYESTLAAVNACSEDEEERWDALLDLNSKVIRQIIETPARTIEGLIFKADICEREGMHPDLAESLVADLLAIGGHDA